MEGRPFRLLTVSDLHRRPRLYAQLGTAVARHRPNVIALVGDVLDAMGDDAGLLSNEAAAKLLAELPCDEMVFVRGNHEDNAWLKFFQAWPHEQRPMRALHASSFRTGPITLVGFPCLLGDETAFVASLAALGDQRPELADLDFSRKVMRWLPGLVKQAGPSDQTIWLLHEPPAGLPIAADSPVMSRPEWTRAITKHQPLLTISGHDHRTPIRTGSWHARLGRTTCFNAGQSEDGPLHYLLVEAVEATDDASVVKVTRHPNGNAPDSILVSVVSA